MKLVLALLLAVPLAAAGQSYPSRPIRVISDSAAGSPGDVALRLATQKMTVQMGQPVVVEMRTGAGGQIAAGEVLRAGLDGYTVLYSSSLIMVSRFVMKSMKIDVQKDLAPISPAARSNNFLLVHRSVPVATLPEFIAYLKKNPGKLTYSSNGIGSSLHIQWVGFLVSTGTDMLHVPYGSGNNSMRHTDFFVGRTSAVMTNLGSVKKPLDAGDIRALAMIGDERTPSLPDVPAITEVIPNVKLATGFWGFWGPAGLPDPILTRLSGEVQKALKDPETVARLEALDIKPFSATPPEFAKAIANQMDLLRDITTAAGITPQ